MTERQEGRNWEVQNKVVCCIMKNWRYLGWAKPGVRFEGVNLELIMDGLTRVKFGGGLDL